MVSDWSGPWLLWACGEAHHGGAKMLTPHGDEKKRERETERQYPNISFKSMPPMT
jgi:hypothetical protein